MDIIGLIAEYNPFHNGHLYQINKIKELYPNSIIILVLNGYFLERGIISLESKEEKTKLALKYGVDIVLELPFVYGSQSSDIFAESSIKILNNLKINKLVFGSESNNIEKLKETAAYQLTDEFNEKVKTHLNEGINYPTALNKAGINNITEPNDLLGLSYIKSIIKNNYNIDPITIKRTNSYHDNNLDDSIVSASNIREKFENNLDISKYIPEGKINNINYDLLFNLLKTKILTDKDLSIYLTVDEGIENKLKKEIINSNNIEELVDKVKTKRYTYNRIMRMLTHILIGLTKEDNEKLSLDYIRLLGFNKHGKEYINSIKKDITIPVISKVADLDSLINKYEQTAAIIYEQLTNDSVNVFENSNKPIIKED